MKIWLTHGMFGEPTELISETDTAEGAFKAISGWKDDKSNRMRYKVEPYNRIIFRESSLAVDFGDYSWFFLVDGMTKENMRELAGNA